MLGYSALFAQRISPLTATAAPRGRFYTPFTLRSLCGEGVLPSRRPRDALATLDALASHTSGRHRCAGRHSKQINCTKANNATRMSPGVSPRCVTQKVLKTVIFIFILRECIAKYPIKIFVLNVFIHILGAPINFAQRFREKTKTPPE